MVKVALIIGHSKTDSGAVNKTTGQTEYEYNTQLVERIKYHLDRDCGVDAVIVHRDTYSGLPTKVNDTNADIALEFHCNAFNGNATGTEMLYWHTSGKGKELARLMQSSAVSVLELSDRGAKPITNSDRGGYLLRKTSMPTVIVESFFIDNDQDLATGYLSMGDLAIAYANAIESFKP